MSDTATAVQCSTFKVQAKQMLDAGYLMLDVNNSGERGKGARIEERNNLYLSPASLEPAEYAEKDEKYP